MFSATQCLVFSATHCLAFAAAHCLAFAATHCLAFSATRCLACAATHCGVCRDSLSGVCRDSRLVFAVTHCLVFVAGSLVRPKVVKSVHFCPATGKTIERRYTDMTSLDAFPSGSVDSLLLYRWGIEHFVMFATYAAKTIVSPCLLDDM